MSQTYRKYGTVQNDNNIIIIIKVKETFTRARNIKVTIYVKWTKEAHTHCDITQ